MSQRTFIDEQRRNRRSSILLAVIISLFLLGLVTIITFFFVAPDAVIYVLPFSLVIIIIYTWSMYQYGDRLVLSSTKARPAEGDEFTYLNNVVEGLSIAAGVPPPKVYVIDNSDINAFAAGKDPQHASITVTTGALKTLSREELEGVVGHEMSHVRNHDVQFMTYIVAIVGIVSILSHIILLWAELSVMSGGGRRRGRRSRSSLR